jgi:nucleoside-diphosphate-sugar epimerase
VNVLVTGANGFVGSALSRRLSGDSRFTVRGAVRPRAASVPPGIELVTVGDLAPETDWRAALTGQSAVIHLASRVHVMKDSATDPLAEYRRTNVDGTRALALQAAAAGVRRFLFVSSLKVHGEEGRFSEADAPAPIDPYGVSKHEAERALRDLAARTGMEVVIVRPPLVYGPGAKANFAALMRTIARGIPLPLGAVRNRRSLVAIDNLLDFLTVCLVHPAAGGETFLVSDGEDLSTPDLVRRLGRAMGRPARIFSLPPSLLASGAALVGRRAAAARLLGSLSVDVTKARDRLGWIAPVAVDEGLRRAAGRAA